MTSRLVLGAMYLGTRQDDATSFAILDAFVAGGGRWIDTANIYAFWESVTGEGGQSEELLGRWLKANPGMRDEVLISTKVGVAPTSGGAREGLSARVVEREFARCLDRLGVDRVDMFWAHGEDRSTALEETVEAMTRLAAEGLTDRLGWSNHPAWVVERAESICWELGRPGYSALQLSHSYLQPRPGAQADLNEHPHGWVTAETLDFVARHPEWELWAYSPLLRGSYDRADRPFPDAYRHEGNDRRLAVLADVAAELGVAPGQVVLAWLTGGEPAVLPVIGVSSVEQIAAGLAGAALELSPEQRARLDAAY